MSFKTCSQTFKMFTMFKSRINMNEIKNMQEELVCLIRQICDAESLEIIHGSIKSIIKAKKLVIMKDNSCGPSQPNMDQESTTEGPHQTVDADQQITSTTAPEEHEREEAAHGENEEEEEDGDCESDMGDLLVEGDNGTMILKEDGDYLTQIIMDVLPPPRIILNQKLEDCDYDSWFENFDSANINEQVDIQPVQVKVDNDEEERRTAEDCEYDSWFANFNSADIEEQADIQPVQEQENNDQKERRTVVEEYLRTPIEKINGQCPFFLTTEEAYRLSNRDFSPIREVDRWPAETTSTSQTQSNFSI